MSVYYRMGRRSGVGVGCVGMTLIGFPLMVLLGGIIYVAVAVGHAVAPLLDTLAVLAALAVLTWLAPSFYRGFRSAYDGSTVAGWVGVGLWYGFWAAVWAFATWLV